MTRKDILIISSNLKQLKPKHNKTLETYWRNMLEQFAKSLAFTNPHFDREKFYSACGYKYPQN